MPYADPEKQKAAKAAWYRARYASDPDFRRAQVEKCARQYVADPAAAKARVYRSRARAKFTTNRLPAKE